jgi:hypothetical protein
MDERETEKFASGGSLDQIGSLRFKTINLDLILADALKELGFVRTARGNAGSGWNRRISTEEAAMSVWPFRS